MNFKTPLFLALSTSILLTTGCAESQTLGATLGKTVGDTINAVVSGTVAGIKDAANQTKAKNTKSGTISNDDLVYLLGWMEDGCLGSISPYNNIREDYSRFTNSVIKTVNDPQIGGAGAEWKYIATPRDNWDTRFKNVIKDIQVMEEYGPFVTYKVNFKENAKYRGQPIDSHIFSFVAESEGSEAKLIFDPSANVRAIWSNFYTREYEPYWGDYGKVYTIGASYTPGNNTITCEND